MITAYVGSYSRFDLALGAVESLRRNVIGGVDVKVISMGGCPVELPGCDVLPARIDRWCGHMVARGRSRNGEPYIYIDDDVRLIEPVDLVARYGNDCLVMPKAGHMLQYRSGVHRTVTQHLRVVRGGGLIASTELREAADAARCELIDDIWLHIDKGHEAETAARRRVIEIVDGNPLP